MEERDPVAELIAQHNADAAPPPDWQARVWAEIAREAPSTRARWAWIWGGAIAALAAAVVLFLATRPPPTQPFGLAVDTLDGAGAVRAAGRKPGDLLRLEAHLGGAAYGELRVYRDDATVVLACADAAPCARAGDTLRATVAMPSVGRYQALVIAADAPIPGPPRSLESDLAALRSAGARIEIAAAVEID